MPAFPHLTSADVDNVVAFLTTPAGRAGEARAAAAVADAAVPARRVRRAA